MRIDSDVSKRIEILRVLMIFGVVVLHVANFVPLNQIGPGVFDFIKALFQHSLFRTTVAVLTFISGYLLFGSMADRSPVELWKKKFRVLVIPFLFFNLTLLGLAYVVQRQIDVTMSYQLVGASTRTWLNAALSLTADPINYPLHFLRDMIVLMLLAPLFGVLLRQAPYPGLVLVVLVFFNNLDGPLILRNLMPIQFFMGGLAAVKRVDMKVLDKYAPLLLPVFLSICVAMVHYRIANRTYLILAAPYFVWPSASLIVNTRFGNWVARYSRYSFFIFIAHAPVLILTWMIYQKLDNYLPYPVYWVATPFFTVALLIAVHRTASRLFPGVFNALIGSRTRPRKRQQIPVLDTAPARIGAPFADTDKAVNT